MCVCVCVCVCVFRLVEDHDKTLDRVAERWKQNWPMEWDDVSVGGWGWVGSLYR